MAKLGSDLLVVPQDVLQTSSTAQAPLGARASTPDGRVFRYCQFGSTTNLVAGNIVAGAIPTANHLGLSPTSNAGTGTFLVTVTAGATAVSAGQYANGVLTVNAGAGRLGYTYSIVGNTACASSGTSVVTIGEPLAYAVLTGDTVSLFPNIYSSIVQNATSATVPLGVAVVNGSAAFFGWIQTRGSVAVLSDAGAPAIGSPITPSVATAGSVSAGGGTTPIVGFMLQAATSAQTRTAFVQFE